MMRNCSHYDYLALMTISRAYDHTTFLAGYEQLYHGITNEKTAICMCIDPYSSNNTLYLSSSHADAYIVNGDKNKVFFPASVDVTSNTSQRSCIYLILVSTRLYEISGYFIAGSKNTSFSFPIQVASISPFNITEKNKGEAYMKTYLHETVQFISRISRPIGSMLFQWDFDDGNVTQIEKQDGALTISHAYEKAGCFFATNSWLFLSDNQTVERFSITLQIEVLRSRSTSVMLEGEDSLQNSVVSSNFWEVSKKGHIIGYVDVSKSFPYGPSNETHIKEAFLPQTSVKSKKIVKREATSPTISLDPQSLAVFKHNFNVTARALPPMVYNFTFQTESPISIVKTFPAKGRATLNVGGRQPSNISVAVTQLGNSSFKTQYAYMIIRPMKEFSCFNVTYKSDHLFEVGKPLIVNIVSCGLDSAVIHYNLTCSGKVIFKSLARANQFMNTKILLVNYGNLTCDLEAFIPHKPGVLQKYSAPGIKISDRQHIFIYNKITNLSVIFISSGSRFFKPVFPKGHNITIAMECDGTGAEIEIVYLDKNISVGATWNATAKRSSAKYNITYSGNDSYNLHIKALNLISHKEDVFSVEHFDGKCN